jgi:hypothetical protein
MSSINEFTKKLVRNRADSLCEYCHSPEKISTSRFTLDHLQPRSLGGSDTEENLALACNRCNAAILPLFNPRTQSWSEHFIWTVDATKIIGTTAIGRATCDRLDMNDEKYKGERSIQEARALWLEAGWHPPKNDPQQSQT